MHLEDLISKHQMDLNATDWEIYNTIKTYDNKKKITIQEIADSVHVSTTTIYRFCKKIGLSGFSELTAMLNYYPKLNESLDFSEIKKYYHAIVRYIDQYNTSQLFEKIVQSEKIYILARSAMELRVAREMVRIFMPIEKIIIILPNNKSSVNHLENLSSNILFCIDIDFNEDYPIEFKNFIYSDNTFVVLFSHQNRYLIPYNEHILLPTSTNSWFTENSYTQYMMSIEILYLKYMLS